MLSPLLPAGGAAFQGGGLLQLDPAIARHITMLSAALESIEGRAELLASQLTASNSQLATCKAK